MHINLNNAYLIMTNAKRFLQGLVSNDLQEITLNKNFHTFPLLLSHSTLQMFLYGAILTKRSSNISLGTYHFVSDKDIYKGVKNYSYDRNRKDRDQFQMKNKTNRKKAAQRKTERQLKFVFQKNESEFKSRKRDCGQCFTVEENISLSPLMEKKD